VRFGSPVDVSPDGTQLVRNCGAPPAEAVAPSGYGLIVQDVDGGHSRVLVETEVFDVPYARWSPDGGEIALMWFNRSGIDIIDIATGNVRTITPDVPVFGTPSWTPDGTRLIVAGMVMVDVATGATTGLADLLPGVPGSTDHRGSQARWAPDGWVYFEESASDGTAYLVHSISRLDPATGALERLLDIPNWVEDIELLPDGRVMAHLGFETLVVMASDGTAPTVIQTAYPMHGFVAPRPVPVPI
jgi:TolB protein